MEKSCPLILIHRDQRVPHQFEYIRFQHICFLLAYDCLNLIHSEFHTWPLLSFTDFCTPGLRNKVVHIDIQGY